MIDPKQGPIALRPRLPAEQDRYIVEKLAEIDPETIGPASTQWPTLLALVFTAKARQLGLPVPGTVEDDIAALPADRAFQP